MKRPPSAEQIRAQEREACARVADAYERAEQEPQYKIIPREIAAAIRRRKDGMT
jgi:hypothetical protein